MADRRELRLTQTPRTIADQTVTKHFDNWRRDLIGQLPQFIADAIAGASFSSIALRIATPVSIPDGNSGTPTTILTWDTQDYGNNTGFGTVPTDRLIAPSAGLYFVYAGVEWEYGFAGSRSLQLIENAANTPLAIDERPPTQANPPLTFPYTSTFIARNLVMAAGDYVRVRVFQNSGGPLNLILSAQAPIFGLTRLSGFP